MQEPIFSKDDCYKNLERVNFWIANVDTKTSFILALIGVVLGVFLTSSMTADALSKLIGYILKFHYKDPKAILIGLTLVLIVAFIWFLGKCVYYLLEALTATINTDDFMGQNFVSNSNLFFASISNKNFQEFNSGLRDITKEALLEDITCQTYINAKICTRKFQKYNMGIKKLKCALIIFLILTSVFSIIKYFP